MLVRAILVGVGVIFLIIMAVIVASLLNSSSNAQNQRLLEIAQTQGEIGRIADASSDKISSSELAESVATLKITTISAQKDVVSLLSARGADADDKQLALGENPANDKILTEAEQNSRFDEALLALLEEQLSNYQIRLEAAYNSGSASEQEVLSGIYDQLGLLREQLKSISG